MRERRVDLRRFGDEIAKTEALLGLGEALVALGRHADLDPWLNRIDDVLRRRTGQSGANRRPVEALAAGDVLTVAERLSVAAGWERSADLEDDLAVRPVHGATGGSTGDRARLPPLFVEPRWGCAMGHVPADLPGAELVDEGLRDLAQHRATVPALLVSIGAPRLRRLGFAMPSAIADPEHRL